MADLDCVGKPERIVFGLSSLTYLHRALTRIQPPAGLVLVVRADVIATEWTLRWLATRPGVVLLDRNRRPSLGFALRDGAAIRRAVAAETAVGSRLSFVTDGSESVFVRALRRREAIEAIDLRARPMREIERRLFATAYKSVTDLVTDKLWPRPAFHVVRMLAACGVRPNAVTIAGMVLMMVAAWRFYEADWWAGLGAAWAMTFLDTVDGKLARVTGTSSRVGNLLDHGTDIVHPPIWWTCVSIGIAESTDAGLAWPCLGVILVSYGLGRISEVGFKTWFGFNQYLWQPFDARLRAVIARRNTNLAILTVALPMGAIDGGWTMVAVWSIVSIGMQIVRSLQALHLESRGGSVSSWLADDRPGTALTLVEA